MPVFVALLRGVNVGKGPRVPMAAFAELLGSLGHRGVKTLLNSGNAVFHGSAAAPAKHALGIEQALRDTLQVPVRARVLRADELEAVIAANPVTPPDPSRLLVAFADAPALAALARIAALVQPPEVFHLAEAAAFLHCPAGIHDSRAASALLASKGGLLTTRNWATVLKLRALAAQAQSDR